MNEYWPGLGFKNCLTKYNKRAVSRINPNLLPEEYFTKHINIKTRWKQKLIAKAINLIKLRSLGGETCGSN